jgi:hypothetical protein
MKTHEQLLADIHEDIGSLLEPLIGSVSNQNSLYEANCRIQHYLRSLINCGHRDYETVNIKAVIDRNNPSAINLIVTPKRELFRF